MTFEKRLSPRKEVDRLARLSPVDSSLIGRLIEARILDISNGGISIMSPENLTSGARYKVQFEMPFNDTTHNVSVIALVVYSTRVDESSFRIGLQFVELDLSATELIDDFID